MKKIIPFLALTALISCKGNIGPDKDNSIVPEKSVPAKDSASPVVVAPTATPVEANPQPAKTAVAGLNPEHGQPKHRCDIPVGAPLSTPVQAQPQATATQPVATPATKKADGTLAKLNPPHGEPGHDCKIPVGQPLD